MSNPDPTALAQEPDETQLRALFDCMPQLGWGWQTVHHPELLPLVVKRWTHSIATGEPFEMAFQLRRHDGVFRWFLTRVNPMRDAQGRADERGEIHTIGRAYRDHGRRDGRRGDHSSARQRHRDS